MSEDFQKVFVFQLGDEEYGIDVMDVREINKSANKDITGIPESSDFIEGITNLRGQIIPVISLKHRFNIEKGEERFIVIIDLKDSVAGILVDDVKEVLEINQKRIKEAPELLKQDIHDDYVKDVALLEDERMITIIDLTSGFSEEEVAQVGEMSQEEDEDDEIEEVSNEEIRKKAQEKIRK
jgi:purine-binding chemotaxis protein CheW